MPALIEYRLNLDARPEYKYTGTGGVYVFGTASTFFNPVVGVLQSTGFNINEWVYDSGHQIWHVDGIIGTTDNLIAQVSTGDQTAEISTDQLIAFEPGTYYFTVQYLNDINTYSDKVAEIDQKINDLPPEPPPTEQDVYFEVPQESSYVDEAKPNIYTTLEYQADINTYENAISDIDAKLAELGVL